VPGQDVAVAGDERAEAFAAELSALFPRALRLAAGMLLDPAAAEDAVQEAAIRAWRKRANLRAESPLGPWFLAIVANQCREVRRGRWVRVLGFPAVPAEPAAPPATDPSGALDVRRALRRLEHRDRLALVLRYYLDLPLAEVATVSGCSVEAARSRVRRGEAALRSQLGAEEGLVR
jgi:RNA polymerase sigma-70 factor (ECF subfamily)